LRVSRTTISNIENGKHRPFLDQAYLAARALGMDISEVLPAMGDVFSAQVVATAADDPLSPEGALAVAALATSVRESARAPTRKRRR
jgi:transcriptional regulator with XRE-family HTH domain